jgi:hypothetical protein
MPALPVYNHYVANLPNCFTPAQRILLAGWLRQVVTPNRTTTADILAQRDLSNYAL